MKYLHPLLAVFLLLLTGCNSLPPTALPTSLPVTSPLSSSLATPSTTIVSIDSTPAVPSSTLEPTTSAATDLAWVGTAKITPNYPIVGDKFHLLLAWENRVSIPDSDYEIKVNVTHNNKAIYEGFIKAPPPVDPILTNSLDATLDFTIPEPGQYRLFFTLDGKSVVSETNKDNNVTQSNIIDVPDLSEGPVYSKAPDTAAIAQAALDIEKYRKGDVNLKIVDSSGNHLKDLTVDYQQTKNSFLFGINEATFVNENNIGNTRNIKIWDLIKEAGFNLSTFRIRWSETETSQGVYELGNWRTYFLQKYNLTGYGAGDIRFITSSAEYAPEQLPDYFANAAFDEMKKMLYTHFYNVVRAYAKDIKIWTVLSEPMYANDLHLTAEQYIELTKEGCRAIKDADPTAKLMIIIFNAGAEIPGVNQYEFMKKVIDAKIDFDIIGIELYYNCYLHGNPNPRRTLTGMVELLDNWAAFGKEIWVEEISVSSSAAEGSEGYWSSPWSEDLQAEYIKTAYTLFFSRPEVKCISYWDMSDHTTFIDYGGFLNSQDKPKKSYLVLKNLFQSWKTNGTGITNENGEISFRGFGGDYEINVTDRNTGKSVTQVVKVEEQKSNAVTIIYNPD